MVNERISKLWKLDEIFPSKPVAIQNRLAAELTSGNSALEPKHTWNSPLHCSECFRMTNTSAIIGSKSFSRSPEKIFRGVVVQLLVKLTLIL